MKISNWFKNFDLSPHEISKRLGPVETWLVGTDLVAKTSQDAEALALINGILNDVGVARPHKSRTIESVQGPEKPTLIFLPLFNKDTYLTPATRLVMEEDGNDLPPSAYFTENKPGRIYFNAEVSLSPLLRGLILLHEAKHAEYFRNYTLSKAEELDDWREETLTFEFEFRLLNKLGGKAYSDFVKHWTKRFIKQYDDHNGKGGMLPEPSLIPINILDKFLGPCESKREEEIRRSIVWTNVVFCMFEQLYPTSVEKDKDLFMKEIRTQ